MDFYLIERNADRLIMDTFIEIEAFLLVSRLGMSRRCLIEVSSVVDFGLIVLSEGRVSRSRSDWCLLVAI